MATEKKEKLKLINMKKFKYISLDLTPKCRSEIMDCIPPLHCFQNSCHTNNASEVLLKGVVLLRDAHINDEDVNHSTLKDGA